MEPLPITPEEKRRLDALIIEGAGKATEIVRLFPQDTRGLMLFMAALEGLRLQFPGVFQRTDRAEVVRMLYHWIAAGEPDTPGTVPDLLLKRYGPDVFRKIEESYVPPEPGAAE